MEHKILKTGLHIITVKGMVNVYTEKEYQHLEWWTKVRLKYNF